MEIIKCKDCKYYNEENPREIEERVNNILSNRENKFKSFYLCRQLMQPIITRL